jgi:cyclopropane fatty-acyl-phospholipid synthase-like methyltransferase
MKEQKRKLYDSYVTSHFALREKFDDATYKATSRRIIAVYGEFFPADKKAKILDVACGPGYFGYALRSLGYVDIHGIDVSQEQVDLARQMGLDVSLADAFEFLRDSPEGYDLIISTYFLEHLCKEELIAYMTLVHKALRSGGRFLCLVPNANSPFAARLRYEDLTHEQLFTENTLRQLFLATGMTPEFIGDENAPVSGIKGLAKRLVSRVFRSFWRSFMIVDLGRKAIGAPLDTNLVGVCKKQ